jgi:hypothetical protein
MAVKKVFVTSAQRAAAKSILARDSSSGRTSSKAVKAIAEAKVAKKQPAAASKRA